MNKQARNDIRIEKIMNERKNLLSLVKENIIKDNTFVKEEIENVKTLLNYDEASIKKYNAIVKAQNLIEDLTKQIVEAETPEDVMAIRNKLNYYINKIKNEALARNIDINEYNKYYEKASILRKDIAKYIRFLKKEQKIQSLKQVNDNYESLRDEEKQRLSHELSNERDYNTRIMKKPIESTYTIKVKKTDSSDVEETSEEVIDNPVKKTVSLFSDISRIPRKVETYADDTEFLSAKVADFNTKYSIIKPYDYKKSIPGNMINYLKNISVYFINRKSIRKMMFDFENFYGGDDFYTFIEFNRANNSYREGLRSVFRKSALYNNENRHLNSHQRCIEWMLDFIHEKGITFNYQLKEKTV